MSIDFVQILTEQFYLQKKYCNIIKISIYIQNINNFLTYCFKSCRLCIWKKNTSSQKKKLSKFKKFT